MAVSPSGILSLPLSYLETTVANSSTFQTWTGTANAAAAKARIHIGRAASTADLPLAGVGFGGEFRRYIETAPSDFQTDSVVELFFTDNFSSSLSEEDAAYTFLNQVGPIMSDIETLSVQAGYLSIDEWSIKWGPERTDTDEEQTLDYIFSIAFNISYIGV